MNRGELGGVIVGFCEKKNCKFLLLIFLVNFFFFDWVLYPSSSTLRNFNRPILVGRDLRFLTG